MQTVTSAEDLKTPREATVEGFRWQAEKKLELGAKYVELAKHFRKSAPKIKDHKEIFLDRQLFQFCLLACALSTKSLSHIEVATQQEIVRRLVAVERLGDDEYIKELEKRYYLTCGDSVGGSMRNVIGQAAQQRLTQAFVEALGRRKVASKTEKNNNGKIVRVLWKDRHLLFDRKPRFINNSVDFILLKDSENINDPERFLACGELKGGIDPAGADEHWKTADKALRRIESVFVNLNLPVPKLFFAGAAIELSMAKEIFAEVTTGKLIAANLGKPNQVMELADTLVAL